MPQPNGGTVTPVAGVAERVARGIRYAFTGKADWFGPGAPVPATAPEEVSGRQFQMPISVNTLIQTKVEGISFHQLRMLADTCDIIRLLIEVRKNQISALDWSIQKRGVLTARGKAPGGVGVDPKAERLMDFMRSPDKDHGFETWLRYLLEDMFVIDAPTLYVQRTRGGDVYALRPIDGATIKRVIDPHGWVPAPPLPAYQQILQGTAAIDYTTDELIYRPRNMRTNRIYGLSHVEQIIITARTWLARQAYNLEYYDSGTTPDGFLSASKDWGPQDIARYQELFDLQLSGQLGERRKVKVTPSDSKFTETKEPAFKNSYDEWLARIACFCFSIPPTAFVNEMSRATAGTQNIASLETGLAPLRVWIERLMSDLIQKTLQEPEYEFTFRDKEAEDPLERANIDQIYIGAGVLTQNEVRADLGLAPLEEPAPSTLNPSDVPPPPEHGDGTPNPRTAVNIKVVHDHLHKSAPLSKPMKTLADALEQAFDVMRGEIAKHAQAMGKATDADDSRHESHWWGVINPFDTGALSLVADDVSNTLNAQAQSGARIEIARLIASGELTPVEVNEALQQPGNAAVDLLNYRDPGVVQWAEQHSAELITSDGQGGELADATRNMLRRTLAQALADKLTNEQIAALLQQDYAFSRERAELIARTEVHNAEGQGGYAGATRVGMKVKKWLLSNDENKCPVCIANAEQGWVPIDKPFQGGVQAPLQHPRCQCDAAYRRKPLN